MCITSSGRENLTGQMWEKCNYGDEQGDDKRNTD